MSKTFAIVATVALLFSATAFAQNSAPASDSAAPAAAAPSDSASGDAKPAKMHKHHMAKGMKTAKHGGTDHDADKLNACMSNSTPTDQQEQCLKQASS